MKRGAIGIGRCLAGQLEDAFRASYFDTMVDVETQQPAGRINFSAFHVFLLCGIQIVPKIRLRRNYSPPGDSWNQNARHVFVQI